MCLIVATSFDETSFNNEAALNQKLANRRPRKRQATPQRDAHKERGAREIKARGREDKVNSPVVQLLDEAGIWIETKDSLWPLKVRNLTDFVM